MDFFFQNNLGFGALHVRDTCPEDVFSTNELVVLQLSERWPPLPYPTHPDPILPPPFDPILTWSGPNFAQIAPRGQNLDPGQKQVKKGVKIGSRWVGHGDGPKRSKSWPGSNSGQNQVKKEVKIGSKWVGHGGGPKMSKSWPGSNSGQKGGQNRVEVGGAWGWGSSFRKFFGAVRSAVPKRGRSKRSRTQKQAKWAQKSANACPQKIRKIRAPIKIKSALPPPPTPTYPPPPKTRNFNGHRFSCRKNALFPGVLWIDAPISGPRIADKQFYGHEDFSEKRAKGCKRAPPRRNCKQPGWELPIRAVFFGLWGSFLALELFTYPKDPAVLKILRRSNLSETFLAGALYREFREFMRILTAFLGKTHRNPSQLVQTAETPELWWISVGFSKESRQNSHEFPKFPIQCTH